MNVTWKGEKPVIRLSVHEARRCRDCVAIVRRAVRILDGEMSEALKLACDEIELFQERCTPNTERLDREDAEEFPDDPTPGKAA